MSGFVGKVQRFLSDNVPWWLQDIYGGAFLEALGLTLDLGTQTLITGLRQSSPLLAFVDNLPYIGADRGIRQYPNESTQSYRARLQRWRQIKHFVGTHYGQFINLQPYFLPNSLPALTTVHQAGDGSVATWHRLSLDGVYTVAKATPSNYAWDPSTYRWSRFWVFIHETTDMAAAAAPAEYDDGTLYDDGVTVYDGTFTDARIADIVAIINESKAAHSMLAGVALIRAGYSLDASGVSATLPDGSTTYPAANWYLEVDPSTGLPTRPDYITFLYVNPEA